MNKQILAAMWRKDWREGWSPLRKIIAVFPKADETKVRRPKSLALLREDGWVILEEGRWGRERRI